MSQRKDGAAKIVDVFSLPDIWHGYGCSPRCRGHQALVQVVTNATPTSQPTHMEQRHYNAVTPPISPYFQYDCLQIKSPVALCPPNDSSNKSTKLVSLMSTAQRVRIYKIRFPLGLSVRHGLFVLDVICRQDYRLEDCRIDVDFQQGAHISLFATASSFSLSPWPSPGLYPMRTGGKAAVTWR